MVTSQRRSSRETIGCGDPLTLLARPLRRARVWPTRRSPMGFLYFLVIGAVAGWLAGQLTRGHGFGLLGDIVVGIIGAMLGGFLFGLIGLRSFSLIGSLVTATAG